MVLKLQQVTCGILQMDNEPREEKQLKREKNIRLICTQSLKQTFRRSMKHEDMSKTFHYL